MAKDERPAQAGSSERDRKLAEALRANLRRRKAPKVKPAAPEAPDDDPKPA